MPTKLQPSQMVKDRNTGKLKTTHFYIKQTPKGELFKYINNKSGKPKIKQKCMNELARRKIDIVWVDPKE
jgi:hypothetical protein